MKKIKVFITMLLAVTVGSCKKGFLNETANPNAPSSASMQLILTGSEKGAADIINSWGSYTDVNYMYSTYACWIGYWANPSGYISSPLLVDYLINTAMTAPWSDLYDNLADINILETTSTGVNGDYEAIAKILKAYDFEQLVDNYNNVPYTEAFMGITKLTPAYDSGASIYADLLKQCDAAISLINANASIQGPQSDDIIFGGNMANWKKFANSLKLRLILRQSNLSGFSSLASEITSTQSEGYLDGSTQAAAQPGYSYSDSYGGQESPFYREYGTDPNGATTQYGYGYFHANAFCVGLMNSMSDTLRLKEFYLPLDGTHASTVIGAVLGGTLPQSTSAIGPGLLNPTASAILMSGAESLFLQAEASWRGLLPGSNAASLYNAAITASFTSLGLSTAQATAYYGQPSVSYATSTNTLQSIITQKYISLNGFGILEAYNEYRRTGYPAIPASKDPGAQGGGLIPARIFYPVVEYNTNQANVDQQPPPTTATEFNSKIFWAK